MLERLLVEVIAENYRYFLHERIAWAGDSPEAERYCWPPLLSSERQVSGLFASALSKVCPISRPELPIPRATSKDSVDDESGLRDPNRRIDYYAALQGRSVAVELKRVPLATKSNVHVAAAKLLEKQWASVSAQADSALRLMRHHSDDFYSPVGIGLLVIRPSDLVRKNSEIEAARLDAVDKFLPLVAGVMKKLKPSFMATYRAPLEMQVSSGWGDNAQRVRVFPGVMFAARIVTRVVG